MGIDARLKDERSRLGLSQAELAVALKTTKRSVINWEGGDSSPSAEVIAAYGAIGADVLYILLGQHSPATQDERELLALFREAPLAGKMAAIGALKGVLSTPQEKKRIRISAPGGYAAGRDMTVATEKGSNNGEKHQGTTRKRSRAGPAG